MLERIRSEYLEMSGLRLTDAQVERLCGVDRTTCKPCGVIQGLQKLPSAHPRHLEIEEYKVRGRIVIEPAESFPSIGHRRN